MSRTYPITVHWRQANRVIRLDVPEGEYILRSFEAQGEPLPFSCRNGCCTACAVRVLAGSIDQREALGLSKDLKSLNRSLGPYNGLEEGVTGAEARPMALGAL